jgi:hypothetical protein
MGWKYGIQDLGSGKNISWIPDQGVKKYPDLQHCLRENIFFKGLVTGCHSFCLFFIFFITYSTDIHSITFIQSTYPSSLAGASLHILIAL